MSTPELLEWQASWTEEECRRFLADAWEKIERLRDNAGPELTDEEWDELDASYNARMTGAPSRS